jgi:hypothetical protein
VLDASALVQLICHDPVGESWAAQLGQASMVLALEHMLADARDLVDQFEPHRALPAEGEVFLSEPLHRCDQPGRALVGELGR